MTTSSTDLPRPRFARMYQRTSQNAERRGGTEHRKRLLHSLSGTVVEVGAGHGLNFPHYPTTVTQVIAIEPEPTLRATAASAAETALVPVRVLAGTADELPLEDASVDAAVASLVLCSVPDQDRALAEIRRVVRPGGELRFYEHVIPNCQPKRLLAPSRRPQRPLAPDRRRLPPRPRHHHRDPARRLRDRNDRADHVHRLPPGAVDPAHPRHRPPDLTLT